MRLANTLTRGGLLLIVLLWAHTAFANAKKNKHSKNRNHKPGGTPSPSDYLVTGLEDVEPSFASFDGTMYAGMVPFTSYDEKSKAEYMFWMFIPDEPLVKNSLVIWLNGGPGCTSFNAGLLFETGTTWFEWFEFIVLFNAILQHLGTP